MALLIMRTRRYLFRSVHSINSGPLRERRHGHHMYLEVSFNPALATPDVDQIVQTQVLNKLDRHDLTPVLAVATGENIVEWIHTQLRESELGADLIGVAIQETRKNRFVSSGTDVRLL